MEKKVIPEELNFQNNDKMNLTMIPSRYARFMRTCVIWQFIRFVVLNIKMLIVVRKSH